MNWMEIWKIFNSSQFDSFNGHLENAIMISVDKGEFSNYSHSFNSLEKKKLIQWLFIRYNEVNLLDLSYSS